MNSEDGYEDEVSKALDSTIIGFTMENNFLNGLMNTGKARVQESAAERRSLRKGSHWIHEIEEDEGERDEVIKRIKYEFPRHSDLVYFRMPEKTRSSISREAFNGISRLFGENSNVLSEEGFIDCCVIGDLMFDYSYNGLPFAWFGVNQEGQTDVVERIMNGMGEASRRHEKYMGIRFSRSGFIG